MIDLVAKSVAIPKTFTTGLDRTGLPIAGVCRNIDQSQVGSADGVMGLGAAVIADTCVGFWRYALSNCTSSATPAAIRW
jgi:hypothetical protein